MTPHDLFIEARKRGLQIEAAGDKLAVTPKGACPPDFAETLKAHKRELLDWLNRPPCPGWGEVPPGGLPLIPVEPRPTPEDRQFVIGYLLRQRADRPGPLAAWLVRRESEYYDGPGKHWDCAAFSYAAARDAACWQLRREEHEVCELLKSFDETANQRS